MFDESKQEVLVQFNTNNKGQAPKVCVLCTHKDSVPSNKRHRSCYLYLTLTNNKDVMIHCVRSCWKAHYVNMKAHK